MKIKTTAAVALMVLCLFLGAGGTYFAMNDTLQEQSEAYKELVMKSESLLPGNEKKAKEQTEQFDKLKQIYNAIQSVYLEDVSQEALMDGAIQGMVGSLDDEFTTYMNAEASEQLMQSLESSFEGIGAEISKRDGKIVIISPLKGSPAEKEGLRPNDKILSADGESLDGYTTHEAMNKIRGEKGTVVTLEVLRGTSSEPVEVEVTRDTIPLETVYSSVEEVDGQTIGIIEMTSFSEETAADFTNQLEELEAKGIDGLVIDVRGNPGGYLNSVEDIANELFPNDEPFLQQEDGEGNKTPIFTENEAKKPYPIVGVIDRGSASASEILAASLKENGGYDVVGETSFGKGTVQQVIPLDDGSSLKISFLKWLTPNGNWIHEKGVEPTIPKQQPDYYYTYPLAIDEPIAPDTTGPNVESAQLMLKGLGFNPGRTDGYFSSETEKALSSFQEANGLEVTGQLTKETGDVLQGELIEHINSQEDDQQLQKAIDTVAEQAAS
ncbi:S41 family peptidase [Bacillaceae bacterium SIJ1]|uniref:S41 family peptidase n=1 Tax=Litoribacterium kuwaitense TaxID=1398745 RepID=UPI0013ECFC87|nr:S41 family peptidase [Litoribacterium kuwaitense]NGP45358.1 S41 family peptidase [Litoribacterium kuwaitense]